MHTTICTTCSNGCRLEVTTTIQGIVELNGHRCPRGLAHARQHWPQLPLPATAPALSHPPESVLRAVAERYSLQIRQLLPRIAIQGSPERSRFRIVIEDTAHQRFLLEQIDPAQQQRRGTIASFLDTLAAAGLKVIPYCRTAQGEAVVECA